MELQKIAFGAKCINMIEKNMNEIYIELREEFITICSTFNSEEEIDIVESLPPLLSKMGIYADYLKNNQGKLSHFMFSVKYNPGDYSRDYFKQLKSIGIKIERCKGDEGFFAQKDPWKLEENIEKMTPAKFNREIYEILDGVMRANYRISGVNEDILGKETEDDKI